MRFVLKRYFRKITKLKLLFLTISLQITLSLIALIILSKGSNNPNEYPKILEEQFSFPNLEYQKTSFTIKSNKATRDLGFLKFHDNNVDVYTLNNKNVISYYNGNMVAGISSEDVRIPPFDINDDGVEELLVCKNIFFAEGDSVLSVIGYLDYKAGFVAFDTLFPPNEWSHEDSTWGLRANPVVSINTKQVIKDHSTFVLQFYGLDNNFKSRYLGIYSCEPVPRRKKLLQVALNRNFGSTFVNNNLESIFVLGGSSYCNGVQFPTSQLPENSPGIVDTVNDCQASVICFNSDGVIKWLKGMKDGGGKCYVVAPEDLNRTVVAVSNVSNFIDGEPEVQIFYLNRNDGSIVDSIKIQGRFSPFEYNTELKSKFSGLIFLKNNKGQILDQNGNLQQIFNFSQNINLKQSGKIPLIPYENSMVFVVKGSRNFQLVSDLNGKIIALYNGDGEASSVRFEQGDEIIDQILVKNDNTYSIFKITDNTNKIWWLLRIKHILISIVLPPILLFFLYYYYSYKRLRKKSKKLLIRAYRKVRAEAERKSSLLEKTNLVLNDQIKISKEIEVELNLEKNLLNKIVNCSNESIIILNEKGILTKCNDSFLKLFDFEDYEVNGKDIFMLFPENKSVLDQILKSVLENKENIDEFHIELKSSNGSKFLVINASLLISNNSKTDSIAIFMRDLTLIKEMKKELSEIKEYQNIIGRSEKMQNIYSQIIRLSDSLSTVLILGESGTGKELIASAIHNTSSRSNGPYFALNCNILEKELLASELFGHVKGSFSGAIKDRTGRFEDANNGTLFLDEIGDVDVEIQSKLLRAIETKTFERLGENKTRTTNVRLIAATNQNLSKKIENGTFRDDLYYRLNVITIQLPPLRERLEDLPLLINHFIKVFNKSLARSVEGVSDETLNMFIQYDWPGNIRQLKNLIERAYFLTNANIFEPVHFKEILEDLREKGINISISNSMKKDKIRKARLDITRDELFQILEKNGWNKDKTARELGTTRKTIYAKLKKFGLERPNKV